MAKPGRILPLDNEGNMSASGVTAVIHNLGALAEAYLVMKNMPPVQTTGSFSKCGHNSYWVGQYGTCMACRAERAEARVAAAQTLLRNALTYLRDGCGVKLGPSIEAMLATLPPSGPAAPEKP